MLILVYHYLYILIHAIGQDEQLESIWSVHSGTSVEIENELTFQPVAGTAGSGWDLLLWVSG